MVKRITILSMILTISWIGITMAGTIQLPQTGQTTCYDSAGTQLFSCAGTGQDGEYQTGVVWPIPRFQSGSGTETDCMIDNLTGLMWQKNAGTVGTTWQEALDYVQTLNLTETPCGHNDWRLPNVNELESLVHAGQGNTATWLNTQGFQNIQPVEYWSSTSNTGSPENAWEVRLYDGYVALREKVGSIPYSPPSVRGGSSGLAQLWQTGQTKCYDSSGVELPSCAGTGQDGEHRAGVAWPDPRFTVTGDCVTDNLTGLMWIQAPSPITSTWQAALDYTNSFSLCGFDDWRLPNRKEQLSLVHRGEMITTLWLDMMGFSDVPMSPFWTSTNYASGADVNTIDTIFGWVGFYDKASRSWPSWPVRSLISVTQGTTGTRTVVTGSGFGSKKGKVLIENTGVKVIGWTDTGITCLVNKVPSSASAYDVTIKPKPYKTAPPVVRPSAFIVRSPEIASVAPDHGPPKTEITVSGNFFSTKKGKVYVEYLDNGQVKKKNCAVKSWTMDDTTGASEIKFLVPKIPYSGPCTLKVTNKIGTVETTFTIGL